MANQIYPSIVVEKKYISILETLVNLAQYCTIKDITKGAGDTIRVVKRGVTGQADDVAMGEGNTHVIETTRETSDYVLKTTQAKGSIYDEEQQQDPDVLDTLLRGMAETMVNDWNKKIIAEYQKAWSNEVAGTLGYDSITDAVAMFGEQQEAKFGIVHPNTLATLRKALKDELKYSEAFVRTGYIGSVNSIPISVSKAVPEGEIVFADSTAVDLFLNKNQETEQNRDAEHRKTELFTRTVAIPALVDSRHVSRVAAAAATATTVTSYTKNTATVAGAGAGEVFVFVNGHQTGKGVASSNAYSVTVSEKLASGDVVKVVCKQDGHVSSAATVTVA